MRVSLQADWQTLPASSFACLSLVAKPVTSRLCRKSADDHEGNEAEHEQCQLPREDEADDNASSQGGEILEHHADANTRRSFGGGGFRCQASAQRASVILRIIEVGNFLTKRRVECF